MQKDIVTFNIQVSQQRQSFWKENHQIYYTKNNFYIAYARINTCQIPYNPKMILYIIIAHINRHVKPVLFFQKKLALCTV